MGIYPLDIVKIAGHYPIMDENVRERLRILRDVLDVNMRLASRKAGLGETYMRDAIERGRGKLENIPVLVDSINSSFTEWVMTGDGHAPGPEDKSMSSPKNDFDKMSIIDMTAAHVAISQILILAKPHGNQLPQAVAEKVATLILGLATIEQEDKSQKRTPDMIRSEIAGIANALLH